MISLVTGALYYSKNGFFVDLLTTIIAIVIFVLVCAYCSNTDSSENNSSRTYRSNSYQRSDYSSYSFDPYEEQTNYDPTWDDAFFEKTGIEPWFDDNPWDHEKK